jgi:farnesyl diphosphate synthase
MAATPDEPHPASGQPRSSVLCGLDAGVQAQVEAAWPAALPPAKRFRPSAPGDALCQPERRQAGAPTARLRRRRVDRSAAERLEVVASAVELIHSYSLVHDDLPCMDDDVLRRGRPTCHVEYDEATALLVGDSLQSLAFEILARADFGDSHRQLEMVRLLARASGSCGMAGGQAIDLEAVGKPSTSPNSN